MNSSKHKRRWLIQAPIGLVLIGVGVSMCIDAGFVKSTSTNWKEWVPYGTFSLIVLNAGLSVFVDSAIHRVQYLLNKK